jgi:short-subunit dehydrogenase
MKPTQDLDGSVTIVTGASEGIGREYCVKLAQRRTTIVVAARNEQRLLQLKEEIEASGSKALVIPTDVSDEESCKQLIFRSVEETGRIDTLINNSGITLWSRFDEITDTTVFEKTMRVNYLGSVFCTYYALPFLKQTCGRIAIVTSIAGLTGVPSRSAYAASKHAVRGLFESLRIELRGSGVTITEIAPDFVRSKMQERALDGKGGSIGGNPMLDRKVMTAEACAEIMLHAVDRRKRLVMTSFRGQLGRWMKVFAPDLMDHLAAKAIKGLLTTD